MRKGILTFAAACAVLVAGHAAAGEAVLKPTVIDVGKWAEGIAYDGHDLWVAESGQRRIARIDLDAGRVVQRVTAGRLPVDMAATADGTVFAMVNTDKLIYRPSGRPHVLARLGECPSAMIADGFALWALTEPDCSSVSSRLIKVDSRSGAQARSAVLGEWATVLAASGNDIWVAHARGPALTIVDKASLRARRMEVAGASLWAVTAASGNLYAGGRLGEDNNAGVVVMIDAKGQRETHRAEVSERVAEIAGDDRFVVAV
ncbi:MAG TPA: hypothetical protein VGC36_15475, partial [Rhizomicrobium sp.]